MGNNPVLINAFHNSRIVNVDTQWITCTKEDLLEVKHLICKSHRPFLNKCLAQMMMGVTFAFWFEGNRIIFEG